MEEQKCKMRDILINHIDQKYYFKVMNLDDPLEILKELKEIKRCEINVAFTVRLEILNMKYSKGKLSAGDFCEKFEDLIRRFENSPNATPLPESEKRDACLNAIAESVPMVQYMESAACGEPPTS